MDPNQKIEAFRAKNLASQLGLFFTSRARKAYTELTQAFMGASILNHFDLEYHIRIEINASGYAIGGILSQLPLDNFNQWHPIAFFSRKIIPAETRYKTHNRELLAIVKTFKSWRYNLEGCKHKVLVLTNHNTP